MNSSSSLSLAGWQVFTPDSAQRIMQRMEREIRKGIADPYVVHRANEVIAAVAPRQYDQQIEAIREYLRLFFYFVDNPIGEQKIQPVAFMLRDIDARGVTQGACDDAADLVAALGMANGIPARLTAYAFGEKTAPDADEIPFTHVITDLYDGQRWVMLDVTRPEEIHRLPDVVRSLTMELE